MNYNKFGSLTLIPILLILIAPAVFAAEPTVDIISPDGGEIITSSIDIDFNVTDGDGAVGDDLKADIYYRRDSDPFPPIYIGELIASIASLKSSGYCSDTNFLDSTKCTLSNWDTSGLDSADDYRIAVYVTDSIGTTKGDQSSSAFIIDNSPPTATNHNPADGGWSNNVNQPISVTLTDVGAGVDESTINLTVESVGYTTAAAELMYTSGTGLLSFIPSTSFTNGQDVNVSLMVKDNAGNWLMPTTPPTPGTVWSFTIDTDLPGAAVEAEDAAWNPADALSISCNDSASGCTGTYWYYFSDFPGVGSCSASKATYVNSGTFTGTNPQTATLTISSDANNYLCLWVEDTAGNIGKGVSAALRVDATKPSTTSNAPAGWQTIDPVIVDFNCNDPGYLDGSGDENGSGCANTYYQLDGGALTAGTSVSVTGDGTHSIDYYSEDNAGNTEAVNSETVQIDATAPAGASIAINDNNGYTNDATPNLTLSATDATSGIANMRFSCDGVSWGAWVAYNTDYNLIDITNAAIGCTAGEGAKALHVQYEDSAGNLSASASDNTIYDITAPATSDNSPCGWQGADFNITLSVTENLSPTTTYYTLDGNTPDTSSSTGTNIAINSDGNYELKYFTADRSGNTEAVQKATCNAQLDSLAPITTADYNAGWQNSDVNVVLSCADGGSGCVQTQYRVDANADNTNAMGPWMLWTVGSGLIFNTDGNWAVDFNSIDNTSPAHIEATNRIYVLIDKNAPVVNITSPGNGDTIGSSSVTINYTGSDATSGIQKYEVSKDGSTWVDNGTATSYTFTSFSDGSYTLYVRATDNAGNATDANVNIAISIPVAPTSPPAPSGGGGGGSSGGGGGGGSGDWECKPIPAGLGLGTRGYVCPEGWTCSPGIEWSSTGGNAPGTRCCNIKCTPPQDTGTQTCAEVGGYICGEGKVCTGSTVEASDADICCTTFCHDREPSDEGIGLSCTGESCDDDNPCTIDNCLDSGYCSRRIAEDGLICGDGKVCDNGECVFGGIIDDTPPTPTGFTLLSTANVIAGLLILALLLLVYAAYRRKKDDGDEGAGANSSAGASEAAAAHKGFFFGDGMHNKFDVAEKENYFSNK